MAFNTTIRDNVAVGQPDILSAVSANEGSSQVSLLPGAQATSGDGRVFHFAYDGGTALSANLLVQAAVEDDTDFHDLTCASVAVGDKSISVTSTASTISANALAGGFVVFTGPSGGDTYAIAGNTAAAASAFTINLADSIRNALTTPSADVTLNPFNNVVKMPVTATSAPVGVPLVATAGTQYAWVCTRGPVALAGDGSGSIGAGAPVTFSGSTGGHISLASNHTTQAVIGIALETIEGTQWGLVQLNLD